MREEGKQGKDKAQGKDAIVWCHKKGNFKKKLTHKIYF